MGYSLTIGEKIKNSNFDNIVQEYMNDMGEKKEYAESVLENQKYTAKSKRLDEAPAYGEPTDYTNQRWPSYTSWHIFLRISELDEIFLDDYGNLKGGHPGYFELTEDIQKEIEDKYKLFKKRYRKAVPSFEENDENAEEIIYDRHKGYEIPANHILARFEWLIFWMRYTSKNYKEVIISNT